MKSKILTKKDQTVAGILILAFRLKYNTSSNKVNSSELIALIRIRNLPIRAAGLRKIIGHIRRNDLLAPGFLLSDTSGYWYSLDENEMQTVWLSEHRRAINILLNFKPLRRRFKHLLNNKNNLFQTGE